MGRSTTVPEPKEVSARFVGIREPAGRPGTEPFDRRATCPGFQFPLHGCARRFVDGARGVFAARHKPGTSCKRPKPASSGYAEAAEGLRVYYESTAQGEPIVVMAGGFGDISSMAQVIGPLSRERQVIGIDLEGHGRTALRETPMSHERNGDDVAAVLRHLNIAQGRCRRLFAWRRRSDPDGDPASRDGAQPDRHLHRRRARRLVSRSPERHGSA